MRRQAVARLILQSGILRPRPRRFSVSLPGAVNELQLVKEFWRNRHSPVDPALSLFEGLKDYDPFPQIYPVGSKRQGFRDAAAGV